MNAEIKLFVGCKQGRSFLRSLYVSPPFRVVSVGQLSKDSALYLMQMSTSPGVLSGDKYTIDISVEDGACLQMQSQSYQRLYDMDDKAEQTITINVGEKAHFSQVAHPLVPHRNSSFSSLTEVVLGEGSSFLQSEIITCGRKHHGEQFEFRHFSNSVRVKALGVLRLQDKVWLDPQTMPLMELGLLEGYTHQGTLVYQSTEQVDVTQYVEDINNLLETIEYLHFGISQTAYAGFVIRALGAAGETLYEAFKQVQAYLWDKIDK